MSDTPAEKLVPVQAPDGTVGTVPEAEVGQAVDAGAQVVSEDVLRHARVLEQYGGVGGQAAALGAGAARGLSFGLSDLAAAEFAPGLKEDLAGLKEANPIASTTGEIAGAVAPTLLSSGAGAGLSLRGAVRGIGVLPRGVSALGGIAERGVAGLVGEAAPSILGRAAQGALALGARGAAEGAFYGAGQTISESALGDSDITAEKLMAGAGRGALAGLAVGGGFGALEGGASAAMGKLRSKLDSVRAARDVAPTPSNLAPAEQASPAVVPGSVVEKYASHFENAEQLADAWKNRAKLFARHDDTLEQATRSISDDLSKAVKAEQAVDMASFGEAKAAQMARLVPEGDMAARVAQREAALDIVGKTRAKLDELAAAGGGDAKVALKRLSDKVSAVDNKLNTKSASDLFMELDNLKRAVGREANAGGKAFGLTEGQKLFREAYEDLRVSLENQDVWGAAGAAQADINKATAERLAIRNKFQGTFLTDYDKTGFVQQWAADPEKVGSFVRGLTSARNDLKQQTLLDYIQRHRQFLDDVEKHYQLSAAEKAQAAAARQAYSQAEKSIAATSKDVAQVNAARRLMEEEKLHAIGGLSGAVIDTFTKPMTTLARLADIERSVQRVEKQIGNGIGVYFKRPPEPVALGAAKPLRSAYEKRVAEVAEQAADPNKIAQRMADRLGDIGEHAPRVAASAASLEARKVAFLASKIPVGQAPQTGTLQPQFQRPRVSDQEMAKFMRYARAADEPLTLVKDLEHGRVTREAVEAVRTLYPNVYESIRSHVTEHLAASKAPISYQKQLQIGILFQVPTHPTLEPAFVRAMQDAWTAKQQKPPPTRPLSTTANKALQSSTERMEAR